jgi:signal transduction histidine kinase
LLASLAFLALAIALFSLWASRALTAPLARFARVAEEFSLDGKGAALAESGPEEVRILAGALNRLQARIHSMVEDRTRMIAAVGHDLRTPITRLRLKAEFIEDQATRGPIIRDLEQMNAMVHGAMSYLRDGTGGTVAPTDLAILLQTVCDEFSDMGHKVNYIGPDHLVAAAQADDLQRAVANLVENAIKHGTETTVGLERSSDSVTLAVVDNGPGIPAGDKQLVLKPFARGDDARSLDGKTGFGLGLSIADAVARAHRGRLDLLDNQPQGLIARIQIPA